MIDSKEEKMLSFYTSKKILLTGFTGYIGSNLLNKLSGINCEIICLTRKANYEPRLKSLLDSKAKISINSGSYVERSFWEDNLDGVDVIFHLASQTSFYEAESDPTEDYISNVLPLQVLLDVASKNDKKPFISFAGTSTQCGLKENLPVDETELDNPSTIYDLHKLIAENYLKYYIEKDQVNGCCLRLSNVYGPGPRSSKDDRGILNLMIKKALNQENLTIFGSGEYLRDYIFIDDVVRAFLACPGKASKTNGKHFILGSGRGFTVKEAISKVAKVVQEITNIRVNIVNIKSPNGLMEIEFRNFVANNSRLALATGWSPTIDLEEGIRLTVESLKN